MEIKHLISCSQACQLKNLNFGNFMCALFKIFSQQTTTTTIRHTRMAQETAYSLEAKFGSRGYHVYKNFTLFNAKECDEVQVEIETNKDSIKVDPYACAIRVVVNILMLRKQTYPKRNFSTIYFFINKEEGWTT